MRFVRRPVALLAATALLSAGGVATGALTGVASAAPSVFGVTPTAASNGPTTATTVVVQGSGFNPLSDSVKLVATKQVPNEVTSISGTVDKTNPSTSSLTVTFPLNLAAPEPYDVVVTERSLPADTTSTCAACFTVTNPGRPTLTGVARDAANGAGFFIISGTNFAKGAAVQWLKPDPTTGAPGVVDPDFTFIPGSDPSSGHVTGYPSSTQIKGHYTYTPGTAALAGKHFLRVTNADGQASGEAVEFWQPVFTSVAPATLGQGADKVPVTVTGDGIRTGSILAISQFSSTKSDITVGASEVTPDNKSITAPVSVSRAGGASNRTTTVIGPDGGFVNGNGFAVTAGPTVNEADPTSSPATPSSVGRGAKQAVITIDGTGFSGLPDFTFGDPAITATTVSSTATKATVQLTVGQDARLGGHNITVTNPDHGTYTTAGDGGPFTPYPLTINAAPLLTSVSPPSAIPGTPRNVTLAGSGFKSGMTADFGPSISISALTVASDGKSATGTVTVASGAAPGSRDVTVTNPDKGSSVCTGCFGVDSLTVSPTAASNGNNNLTLTFSGVGSTGSNPFTGVTAAKLHKTGGLTDQPDLNGTGVRTTDSGVTATAQFDFTSGGLPNAAAGRYDAIVTVPGGTLSCTGCFQLTGSVFTFTKIAPANGGQGAIDRPITITGTSFQRGMVITIAGATVSPSTFVDATTVTATVTIPSSTATGTKDVTVSNADGTSPVTKTGAFTVAAAPMVDTVKTAAADGKSLPQGAVNTKVSVTGTGFTLNSTVSFSGTGVTATSTTVADATHLSALVSVANDATIGNRDLIVTNLNADGGDGGRGTKANAVTVTATPAPEPGSFHPLQPARVLDTRNGTGAPRGALAAGSSLEFTVTNTGGVPTGGVSSVVLNVTVTAPTGDGFITVYPSGGTRPTASNLNFTRSRTVPNLVVVKVGDGGKVALFNGSGGTVQLFADVAGYYVDGTPTAPGAFSSLAPARLLDTRTGNGAPRGAVAPKGVVHLQVTGRGGVPATGVSSVVLNVTVTGPTSGGYISAYPDGTTRPTASNLNFVPRLTVANLVIVPVSADGKVSLFNGSAGTVQLLADVAGYYVAGTPTAPGAFTALAPSRVLDTRSGNGAPRGAVAPRATLAVQVTGRGGVPASGVSAVVLNVTVTAPTSDGFLTVFPNGTARPTASNLNFVGGQTVPNLVIVPVGADGKVALFNGSAGSVDLLADVAGYYLS